MDNVDHSGYYCQTNIPMPIGDWGSVYAGSNTTDRTFVKQSTENLFPREIYTKFAKIHLTIKKIRVFKWLEGSAYKWHIDGGYETVDGVTTRYEPYWSINWVFRGDGRIQWNEHLQLELAPPGLTGYIGEDDGTLPTCTTVTNGHGCLVNVGIPHRVVTIGDQVPREVVSIFFHQSDSISFEEAKRLLKSVKLA